MTEREYIVWDNGESTIFEDPYEALETTDGDMGAIEIVEHVAWMDILLEDGVLP